MNTVKNNVGPKRVRRTAKSNQLPGTYVALHSTQLARCLAHGLIFLAVRSILRPFAVPAIAELLEDARQGLSYGNVVLVEFEPDKLGLNQPRDGQATVSGEYREVPLAWVRRVVFRSNSERDEFLARASAYDDVSIDALEYGVDATLFGVNSLLGGIVTQCDSERASETELKVCVAIDKVSGVIAAVLASFRWGTATSQLVNALYAACVTTAIEGSPATLVAEFAGAVNFVASSNLGNDLVCVAATILAASESGTGFDVDTFLAELCTRASAVGLDAEMVSKFGSRAAAVLSGATELREDAFTDEGGKVALRALLLFMLNPEVEALQKIRARMGNIGQGVFSLACALAGCHAGIARLGVSTKAPERAVFLGTTLLAWKICFKRPLVLERHSSWTLAGSYENALSVSGLSLASIALPAQGQLLLLQNVLASMGIDSAFEIDTGALVWRAEVGTGSEFFAYSSNSPSFPRSEAINICIHVKQKALLTGIARAATDASLAARESGVFARQSIRQKNKGLELHVCCIAENISPTIISAASDLLLAQAKSYQKATTGFDRLATVPS